MDFCAAILRTPIPIGSLSRGTTGTCTPIEKITASKKGTDNPPIYALTTRLSNRILRSALFIGDGSVQETIESREMWLPAESVPRYTVFQQTMRPSYQRFAETVTSRASPDPTLKASV